MKKNLILGVAVNYAWDVLEPFVASWKKNSSGADMLLFVDNLSNFTRSKLIQSGVLLEDIPDSLKGGVPNNTRWKIFCDFLDKCGDSYEQIFVSDTRDVIFQDDVFKIFKEYKNHLVYATEGDDIRGSKSGHRLNYNWIANCFNKAEADKLLTKKIICDGTTLGTVANIKIFVEKMGETVRAVESRVNFRIHDQAIANYLFYNNLLPIENLIESDVETGAILTVGLANNLSVRGDKICCGENIPAVVHQYDRNAVTAQLVDTIYHDKNFQADERFNDTRSVIEQTISLLYADKIGAATRLFMKKYLTNTEFTGFDKDLLRLFKLAAQKPITQPLELLLSAVQNVMCGITAMTLKDFKVIAYFLKRAEELNFPVEPKFKTYIKNFISGSAIQALNADKFDDYWIFRNMLRDIGDDEKN